MIALQDQLSQIPTHSVTLLEPVPGEPGAYVKAANLRPLPEDGVAIEGVDRIDLARLNQRLGFD